MYASYNTNIETTFATALWLIAGGRLRWTFYLYVAILVIEE
jgi:hypothetical protein